MKAAIFVAWACALGAVANAQEFTSVRAKKASATYQAAIEHAEKSYVTALGVALKDAELKGDADEVLRIKATLEDFKVEPTKTAAKAPRNKKATFVLVRVPGNKAPGAVLGKVNKGDTIIIQYSSGMWSGEHINLTSPDASDKLRGRVVGKVGGAEGYAPVVDIPKGTKEQAFEYTFEGPFESVGLGIDGNSWSCGGEVVYKVTLKPGT